MGGTALKKYKKNILFAVKVILITLLAVFLVRTFFIESYMISSRQMESSLLEGDHVFVDKTAYGIRMPVTILSIPFVFDNIAGIQSYTSILQIPYKRIFEKEVSLNDIILFNNPADTDKPLDKRKLMVSRCIGLAGDTITAEDGKYFINGREYVFSPDFRSDYFFKADDFEKIKETAQKLNITTDNFVRQDSVISIHLSNYEAYLINESLPDSLSFSRAANNKINYTITIPCEGEEMLLTTENIGIYGQIILDEVGENAKIENGKLYINGVEQKKYSFKENYYWVLSDNVDNNTDSNTIGFIPFRNIIGKLRFVWYNRQHSERSFIPVK